MLHYAKKCAIFFSLESFTVAVGNPVYTMTCDTSMGKPQSYEIDETKQSTIKNQ